MTVDRLLDRLLSLAPLGVLIYMIRRHEAQQGKLLELLDRDRAAFRDERRELINRVAAPHLIPQGTRTVPSAGGPQPPTAAQQARAAFAQVGHAAPALIPDALPTDDDDVRVI